MSEKKGAKKIKDEAPGVEAEGHPQVVNLQTSSVGTIKADLVRLHQSAARGITSDEIALHQSAAIDATTVELSAHQAALGMVTTGEARLTNSYVGVLRAENLNLDGKAGVVMAGSANLGDTYAGLVAGREVRSDRIEALLLLARKVDGEVHTVVDTRGAMVAGMVWGLITGVILLLGRLVFGRRD